MPDNSRDISIEISSEMPTDEAQLDSYRRLAEETARRFNLTRAVVSIAIVGDDTILKINRRFLDHDTKTDVISFDLTDDPEDGYVFDIVVNRDRAQREAQSRGHDPKAELALYITHGMLHNVGFDDDTEAHAEEMHRMEDMILSEFGFGRVYMKE